MVLHRQIIAFAFNQGVNKQAHFAQPLGVNDVMHDGVAEGVELVFHLRAERLAGA